MYIAPSEYTGLFYSLLGRSPSYGAISSFRVFSTGRKLAPIGGPHLPYVEGTEG